MKFKTQPIGTILEFNIFSENFQRSNEMPDAYGIGLNYKNSKGELLAVKWLTINVGENAGTASVLMESFELNLKDNAYVYHEFLREDANNLINYYFLPFINDNKHHANIEALRALNVDGTGADSYSVILYKKEDILKEDAVINIADAHFRLSSISRRKFRPNTLCLKNLFNVLPNVVYAGNKVYDIEDWNQKHWQNSSHVQVVIDKIPLLNWGAPIPEGVRMPNPHSARLGAYLSSGTTVMPYGFVNFNAGTLGKAMVEGTIASGVTIDDGTDIGKGGGFLGTLSGGNTVKVSAGKDCLIGALAECGIALGDNCVVATGVCFTANTPFSEVSLGSGSKIVKASHFSGKDNLTFRINSITGKYEVLHIGNKAKLNEDLHKNIKNP
jgi:2,3,4,5-tetrahydropyridine-2-carboxylate N-succinyltransferase